MMSKRDNLGEQQQELVKRFVDTFNAIDHALQDRLGVEGYQPFRRSVEQYAQKHPRWKDGEDLKFFAELRNFIVHSTIPRNKRFVLPVPDVITKIETIYSRLSRTAIGEFAGPVTRIRIDDRLVEVLELIQEKSFSQFPVFNGDKYVDLLTENGITLWMAQHFGSGVDQEKIATSSVAQVLTLEEERENCNFVTTETPLDDILAAFGDIPELEAVLITEDGKPSKDLLGIATPWDIIRLNRVGNTDRR